MSRSRGTAAQRIRVGRVILILLGAAALLGASALVAVAKSRGIELFRDATLPIRHVELVGERRHLTEARARRLLGPVLGSNLIAVDMGELRSRLEAHPWIERAVVARIWPDRLRIRLEERAPIARWNGDQFIDANGHRFDPDGETRLDLPILRGPEGLERALIIALGSSRQQLGSLGLTLDSLTLDERRAWTIRLGNGTELRLGRQEFALRLQRFVDAFDPFLDAQMDRVAAVDLRYTNGFAMRWLPETDGESASTDDGSAGDAQEG